VTIKGKKGNGEIVFLWFFYNFLPFSRVFSVFGFLYAFVDEVSEYYNDDEQCPKHHRNRGVSELLVNGGITQVLF
jgi:hypothetical protein